MSIHNSPVSNVVDSTPRSSPCSRIAPRMVMGLPLVMSLLCLNLLLPVANGYAESAPSTLSTCDDVRVHVRTLEGLTPVESSEQEQLPISLDKRIEDLRDKLVKLHYQQYRLLAEKSAVVPVSKRRELVLSDGHRLTLRPLYANDERVGVWMKWRDSSGMEVLDSRMHFTCNEHILTGLETNDHRGLILAIQVSPIAVENAATPSR
ncbi:MAG: hypothetical protein KDD70_11160 [Bdellovibrionales bacterium]|nr:hypothetical protein [Bdellovibrionales bacterium]